jgi:hypothetical protein
MDFDKIFSCYEEPALYGRYIAPKHIAPLVKKAGEWAGAREIGKSVQGRPIHLLTIGNGPKKILMWSQMHGNEGTTTKALFDYLNFLKGDPAGASVRLACTLYIVPMLNPDGAQGYTRENANNIDLNRDFCNLTQPESKLLLDLFFGLKPHFCFNLHDQRTIYGAGYGGKPATVSFLAPSYNEAREVNEVRGKAIGVIVAINKVLQNVIPGQVGRFDDAFNINCVGDTFQFNDVPTILFEAGHFPGDYQREDTRKFIFIALVTAVKSVYENVIVGDVIQEYLNIPQNKMNFYDFIYTNVRINYDGNEIITNFAAQYQEVLAGGSVRFQAEIAEVGIAESIHGHFGFDARGALYGDALQNVPVVGHAADFQIGSTRFANGMPEGWT